MLGILVPERELDSTMEVVKEKKKRRLRREAADVHPLVLIRLLLYLYIFA